jgi:hypothetical protein
MKDRIRDLFAVPPAEFVAARDALVKELRAAGRDSEAKEVSALRRPAAAVWAVNQLARRSGAEVQELLDASERVQKAQLRGAPGDELREAMAAQRSALARLERGAEQIMQGAGLQPSPGALRTVQSTLQAASTGSREMRLELREGTMRDALEPSGFDALLGAGVAPPRKAPAPPSRKGSPQEKVPDREAEAARRSEAKAAEKRARDEARETKKREREAARLERRLRRLESRAEAAERAAREARDAVDSARAELHRLRG